MTPPEPWDPPSAAVAAHLRTAARTFLDEPDALHGELVGVMLADAPPWLREDPTLAAEVAASNRANLVHWATHTVADPGARVPANLGPEVLTIARDIVRRGLGDVIATTYRMGQNIAWRYTMALAFQLTDDPVELRELLDVAARSIFTFVDDTLAALQDQMERERAELTTGTHAERFETVTLLLEGAPITEQRASARLRYPLDREHVAAVLWREDGRGDDTDLTQAAEALARAAGAGAPLTVVASGSSRWAWLAPPTAPDPQALRAALDATPQVRAAIGPPAAGVDGFRRSHLDAVATQRLMVRMPSDVRVATYEDVRLVALAATDAERAAAFVTATLGELAHADAELRDTVATYLREACSAARAARVLFTHRNTVLNRLARAERLLPAPLDGRTIEVALALEIVHWLGHPRPG